MVNSALQYLMGEMCVRGGGGEFALATAANATISSVILKVPLPSSPGTCTRPPLGGRPLTASEIIHSKEVLSTNNATVRYSFA